MSQEEMAELEAQQADDEATAETKARDENPATVKQNKTDEGSEQLKAELKRERESREKAELAAADLAFKLREKKRGQENTIEDQDEEKPLTTRDLQELLAKEREATRKELQSQRVGEIVSQLVSDETERELILELHKTRSFPSHLSLEEQLDECHSIALGKKLRGENSELKRALSSKGRVSKDSSNTVHDAPQGTQPKLGGNEAQEMARVGFIWNNTNRRYEKKLGDGRLLVKILGKEGTQVV